MNMQPLVSIITPTYNHEKYIGECIQSVLDQTYPHWEMIIVSDGSTDGTVSVAREFASRDSRISVFDRENVGIFRLAETYNFALAKSKGKYVAVLEGDDLWIPAKLESQVRILENNPEIVLTWGAATLVNASNTAVYHTAPLVTDKDSGYFSNDPTGSILNILFFRNCIPALTLLIRREKLIEINGFLQGYNLPLVDMPTLQELSVKGRFYFDPEPLGYWRIYPSQTTKTHLDKIHEGFFKLAKDNFTRFSEEGFKFEHDWSSLEKLHQKQLIVAYSRSGRYLLIRKQYILARKLYLKSLRMKGGEGIWKLRSLVGILFSYIHLDIEGLAKFLGRPSYRN